MTALVPLGRQLPIFLTHDENHEFKGEWKGSLKQPDFAVIWEDDLEKFIIHTVVEVGCSQTRKSLLASRDAYLKGIPSISRFISVNVIEDPEYAAPRNIDVDKVRHIDDVTLQVVSREGPVWYNGI